MSLVFPTIASIVTLLLFAAGVSEDAGWWIPAALLFAGFAVTVGRRANDPIARTRVAVGAIVGVGGLLLAAIAFGESSIRPEVPSLVVLVGMFVIRGRRDGRARSPHPDLAESTT